MSRTDGTYPDAAPDAAPEAAELAPPKGPVRMVRGRILGPQGQPMMYEGPPITFAELPPSDAPLAPLGLRVAVLMGVEVAGARGRGASAIHALAAAQDRKLFVVWRVPVGAENSVLSVTAEIVARNSGRGVHAVLVDDGEHAWSMGVDDVPMVRRTVEGLLRAQPDKARVEALI